MAKFTLSFFLLFCFYTKKTKKIYKDIDKITIFSIDEIVRTFIRMDCESFGGTTPEASRTELTDSSRIADYMKDVEAAKVDTTGYDYAIDVRQKILIHHLNGKIDTICRQPRLHIFYYNGKYYSDPL